MIPKNIEKKHIVEAIEEIKRLGVPPRKRSRKFYVDYENELFPVKYVISLANKYANGTVLEPSEFRGGAETNPFLHALGFTVVESHLHDKLKIPSIDENSLKMSNYWLDIFTATTWKEFRDAGAHTSGFPETRQNTVNKVQPGDVFLCYVTGVSRWVGALEVVGPSDDDSPIWGAGAYPARLEVRPLILRDPEDGVPLAALEGRVSFFQGPSDRPAYKFFLRSSPKLFKHREDGDTILELLEEGVMQPKKYWVEKTLVKGRPDRLSGDYAVGTALWSPQKGKTGREIYGAMREVMPGDVILHLTDNKGFTGVSIAKSSADSSFVGLPGTDWAGAPGYLVRLKDFEPLDPPLLREDFLNDPIIFEQLARILEAHKGHALFYNREHDLNQGAYLSESPSELVSILNTVYRAKTGKNIPYVDLLPPHWQPTLQPRYTREDLSQETGFEDFLVDKWVRSLQRKKHIIIQGPPGTGKTFVAERLARLIVSETIGFYELLQFHPTYAYEDFIQGIHPRIEGGALSYEVKGGRFLDFCAKALKREGAPCVLIIDEINRANLGRVFGELMYLLEYRDKTIPLAYGGELNIPENVYLIGTMNTADRSIALVDHAFRRRFSFIYLAPDYAVLRRYLDECELPADSLISVLKLINTAIDDPHYEVGISFFLKDGVRLKETLQDVWHGEIEPYLEEYFYDRPEKLEPFRWEHLIEAELADWAP
jgi:DNA polymerase III delta prime subunit